MPFILKPEVGFCSMGVYTVYCEEDWNNALASIEHDRQTWNARYPESVIGVDSFLVEAFIEGTEYALDAFFDEQGHAHILNILRHDFASASDTSDRLYLTSEAIIDEVYDVLITWLNNVNALVGVSNFPVHVEVRIEETQGTPLVHAIEFNPLRFAGLGGTDISFHAYGFYSYEAFLENKLPTREQMKEASGGNVFCMSLLNPPKETPVHATFNYDAFVEHFSGMQDLVRFDYAQTGMFGFAFLKVSPEHEEEIEYLKTTDLREFIH